MASIISTKDTATSLVNAISHLYNITTTLANNTSTTLITILSRLSNTTSIRIRDATHTAEELYNTTSSCFLSLIIDTPAEHWLLHPTGQFVTVCLGFMIFSFALAFSLGLWDDIREFWGWVRGRGRKTATVVVPLASVHGEENMVGRRDQGDEDEADDAFSFQTNNRAMFTSAVSNTPVFSKPTGILTPQITKDHRTGRLSTPGYQTPYTNTSANAEKFASNNPFAANKGLPQRDGLFNSDNTLSRAGGKRILGRSGEEQRRAEGLALDEKERARLRQTYLAGMEKREAGL